MNTMSWVLFFSYWIMSYGLIVMNPQTNTKNTHTLTHTHTHTNTHTHRYTHTSLEPMLMFWLMWFMKIEIYIIFQIATQKWNKAEDFPFEWSIGCNWALNLEYQIWLFYGLSVKFKLTYFSPRRSGWHFRSKVIKCSWNS